MPFEENVGGLLGALGGQEPGGAAPPTNAQTQAYYTSIVDYINNHGGLLGHPIQPVFDGINPLSTSTGAAVDQAQCTDFTQDHHVFAVMGFGDSDTTFLSCMRAANVITFDPATFTQLDDATFAQYPLYATAGTLSVNRDAAVLVNGLFKDGFFGTNPKIGLVAYNTQPFTQSIDNDLKPALAQHGLHLTDETLITPVTSVADYGPSVQAMTNGILRFKEEGIDHVIYLDVEGATLQPWETIAASQKYFPRLGFTSNEMPGERSYPGNKLAPAQVQIFSTALAVGWNAGLDLNVPPTNSTGALCNQIMEGAGASQAAATNFWGTCDQLLTFADAVNAGGQLTPTAAMAGLAKATNLQSAQLLGSPDYAGGRRDGAAYGRFLAYNTGCQCFQYNSGTFPLSSLENS